MKSRLKQLAVMMEGFHALKMNLDTRRREVPQAMRITGSQWLVLGFIARRKSASIKDISQALNITSSAATQVVNELLKAGSVVKRADRSDKRVSLVTLSSKARRELASMRSAALKHMQALYASLSDREFSTYMHLTEKIIRAAKSHS